MPAMSDYMKKCSSTRRRNITNVKQSSIDLKLFHFIIQMRADAVLTINAVYTKKNAQSNQSNDNAEVCCFSFHGDASHPFA